MRIKYSLLPKLRNLTCKEMDFFLYIARYQDLAGHVPGVHNQDVCRHTGMCKQSFYTVMRSLEGKGIIQVQKCSEIDYDIQIRDNDFSYEGAFQEGYVNLHRQVFHTKNFKRLKANEQYLLMEFLKNTHESRSSYQIGTAKFYAKYTELLGVTKRVIRYYIHSLRSFFSIGIKHGKYFITYLHSVFQMKESKGVEAQEFEYFIMVQYRRLKIKEQEDKVADLAGLIKQYRPEARNKGLNIKKIIVRCIEKSVTGSCTRKVNVKYIHKLVREALLRPEEAF